MELKMRGEITWHPEAIGKQPIGAVALLGNFVTEGGVTIFEMLCDYHVCYEKRASDGYEKVWLVSRPVTDRAKYPNWPKPEPGATIKRQAESIAEMLKAFERGEKIHFNSAFVEKMEAARDKPSFAFGIRDDDGPLKKIEMPWTIIREKNEVDLAECIVRKFHESNEPSHLVSDT